MPFNATLLCFNVLLMTLPGLGGCKFLVVSWLHVVTVQPIVIVYLSWIAGATGCRSWPASLTSGHLPNILKHRKKKQWIYWFMTFVRMLVMCCYVRARQGGSEWTLCKLEGQGLKALGFPSWPRGPNKHANTYRHPYNTMYKVQFRALGSVRHHTWLISLLGMFWEV